MAMSDRYSNRRQRLAAMIGDSGIAIIPAASETIRNYDVSHEFRQDSMFWYLTGFHEPDAIAVITPGHDEGDFTLFVLPKDPLQEVWTGIRTGPEGAEQRFGADAAHDVSEFDSMLERLVIGREVVWYRTGDRLDSKVSGAIERARGHRERFGGLVPAAVRDVSAVIGEMMLYKDEFEIESMRRACELTAFGHAEAMRFTQPGMMEYEVQAALEYFWRLGGSPRNGYPSIVASGANACILHYVSNDSKVGPDDLVLVDAAAEIDGYTSDITRTFPASGKFTGPQRAVYDVVLAAQESGLQSAVRGSSIRAIHERSTRSLVEGMVELGLLPLSVEESLAMHHYTEFFMHGTGHWLGLDVHDRGSYRVDGKPRPLEAGMIFTVEPGIYVAPDKTEVELALLPYDIDERAERRIRLGTAAATALEKEERDEAEKIKHAVPPELLGIGVRIEDDILITAMGYENLTEMVPKTVEGVESVCAENSTLPRTR